MSDNQHKIKTAKNYNDMFTIHIHTEIHITRNVWKWPVMKSDEWRPGGCSKPVVRLQRRHGHLVLTFVSQL